METSTRKVLPSKLPLKNPTLPFPLPLPLPLRIEPIPFPLPFNDPILAGRDDRPPDTASSSASVSCIGSNDSSDMPPLPFGYPNSASTSLNALTSEALNDPLGM